MTAKRVSIQPTYDSRQTGPRYHVTSKVNGRVATWRQPVPDPFVRTQVFVMGWRDLLGALLRHRMVVEVLVGGDPEVVEDVMELDANYLGTNCTRRDEFDPIGQVIAGPQSGDGPTS